MRSQKVIVCATLFPMLLVSLVGWREAAVLELQHAAHALGQVPGVRDDYEGHAFLAVQFQQQLPKLLGGGVVEGTSGLVGEQEHGAG